MRTNRTGFSMWSIRRDGGRRRSNGAACVPYVESRAEPTDAVAHGEQEEDRFHVRRDRDADRSDDNGSDQRRRYGTKSEASKAES